MSDSHNPIPLRSPSHTTPKKQHQNAIRKRKKLANIFIPISTPTPLKKIHSFENSSDSSSTPEMPSTPVRTDSPNLATPRLILQERPRTPSPNDPIEPLEFPKEPNKNIVLVSCLIRRIRMWMICILALIMVGQKVYCNLHHVCQYISPFIMWVVIEILFSIPLIVEWVTSTTFGFKHIKSYIWSFFQGAKMIVQDLCLYLIIYIVGISCWELFYISFLSVQKEIN